MWIQLSFYSNIALTSHTDALNLFYIYKYSRCQPRKGSLCLSAWNRRKQAVPVEWGWTCSLQGSSPVLLGPSKWDLNRNIAMFSALYTHKNVCFMSFEKSNFLPGGLKIINVCYLRLHSESAQSFLLESLDICLPASQIPNRSHRKRDILSLWAILPISPDGKRKLFITIWEGPLSLPSVWVETFSRSWSCSGCPCPLTHTELHWNPSSR